MQDGLALSAAAGAGNESCNSRLSLSSPACMATCFDLQPPDNLLDIMDSHDDEQHKRRPHSLLLPLSPYLRALILLCKCIPLVRSQRARVVLPIRRRLTTEMMYIQYTSIVNEHEPVP